MGSEFTGIGIMTRRIFFRTIENINNDRMVTCIPQFSRFITSDAQFFRNR